MDSGRGSGFVEDVTMGRVVLSRGDEITGIGDPGVLEEIRRRTPATTGPLPYPVIPKVAERDPSGLDPHAPGAKLDAGKVLAGVLGDFSLALLAVAEVGSFGAKKYSRGGWQSVERGVERYNDAKWRHLLKGQRETHDPDSHLSHLAHEAWNVLAQLELTLRKSA